MPKIVVYSVTSDQCWKLRDGYRKTKTKTTFFVVVLNSVYENNYLHAKTWLFADLEQ